MIDQSKNKINPEHTMKVTIPFTYHNRQQTHANKERIGLLASLLAINLIPNECFANNIINPETITFSFGTMITERDKNLKSVLEQYGFTVEIIHRA